jgi:hypothetical protein
MTGWTPESRQASLDTRRYNAKRKAKTTKTRLSRKPATAKQEKGADDVASREGV